MVRGGERGGGTLDHRPDASTSKRGDTVNSKILLFFEILPKPSIWELTIFMSAPGAAECIFGQSPMLRKQLFHPEFLSIVNIRLIFTYTICFQNNFSGFVKGLHKWKETDVTAKTATLNVVKSHRQIFLRNPPFQSWGWFKVWQAAALVELRSCNCRL